MGAVPVALLVGFAAPGDLPLAWARELVAGIADECARVGATVVGGDTSSAETVVLAITALGDLAGRDPVTRAGARPGDVLAIAGVLGGSAAGLALLEAGLAGPAPLLAAHRRPRPPYAAGPQAARARRHVDDRRERRAARRRWGTSPGPAGCSSTSTRRCCPPPPAWPPRPPRWAARARWTGC